MKERVKELAKEAYESCFDDRYVSNYSTDRLYEKFAELIVQECIKACRFAEHDNHPKIREGAVYCIQDIKEHFGVK